MLLRGNQNPSRCTCIAIQFCFLFDKLSWTLYYKEIWILFPVLSFPHTCLTLPQFGQEHLIPGLLLLDPGVLQVHKPARRTISSFVLLQSFVSCKLLTKVIRILLITCLFFSSGIFLHRSASHSTGNKKKQQTHDSLQSPPYGKGRPSYNWSNRCFNYKADLPIIMNRCSRRSVIGCDSKKGKTSTYVI